MLTTNALHSPAFTYCYHVKNVLEFKALWEAIDYDTKAGVAFHLRQLLNAIDRGQNASIPRMLTGMEYYLTGIACHTPLSADVVTSFMNMLRHGTPEIIRTITELADDNMPEDTDEEMRGNNSDGTMSSTASSSSPGSDSDDSMADGSENMSFGSVHSRSSGLSNEPMLEMRGGDSDVTMSNTASSSSPGSGSDDSMRDVSENMSFGAVHSSSSASSNEPMPDVPHLQLSEGSDGNWIEVHGKKKKNRK